MNFAMICDVVGGDMKSYYIKDNKGYDFNGILSLKPDKVNESTRSLLTAQKFINQPLVIYNDKSNFEACGVAVAIE